MSTPTNFSTPMYHAPRAMSPTKQSTRGSLASLPSFGRFLTCSTPPNHVVKRLPPSTPIVDCLAPFNPFLTVVGSPKPTLDASPCVYDNCDKFAKINKLCLGHFRLITSSAATPRQPIHPVSPALSAVDRPKYANRRCKHLGCSKYGLAGGFCISHGGGKKCLDDGCDTTAQSGGYCKSHGGGSRCRFENCPRIAKRKGVCKEHGGRHLCKVEGCGKCAHKSGLCVGHGGGRKCSVDGCVKTAQGKGVCYTHGGGKRCSLEGCNHAARRGGFCITHTTKQ
ncbi:hypothetical protein H310_07252 [Aphanomyces invadans]|uniref:WRKY19-like zinc finger domain-containing protein n=1 Tax=Aphanomyces invadans TaxID=157072 RepID=A0A024U4Y4_9STRA|nr:hypothetical protein H310_07252 [Aphanomyces invadans]ETW00693.1 hypothetical protein H310_07252 [Aphanomyces invadans]|eukprot:XP_008870828.1 hypothetical protein H310_07252 [Aphanomyces invadans]